MLTTYDGIKLTKVTSLYFNDVLTGLTPLFRKALKKRAGFC